MAPWVKCLLCKHQGEFRSPNTHHGNLGVVAYTSNPSTGTEIGRSWELTGQVVYPNTEV